MTERERLLPQRPEWRGRCPGGVGGLCLSILAEQHEAGDVAFRADLERPSRRIEEITA